MCAASRAFIACHPPYVPRIPPGLAFSSERVAGLGFSTLKARTTVTARKYLGSRGSRPWHDRRNDVPAAPRRPALPPPSPYAVPFSFCGPDGDLLNGALECAPRHCCLPCSRVRLLPESTNPAPGLQCAVVRVRRNEVLYLSNGSLYAFYQYQPIVLEHGNVAWFAAANNGANALVGLTGGTCLYTPSAPTPGGRQITSSSATALTKASSTTAICAT